MRPGHDQSRGPANFNAAFGIAIGLNLAFLESATHQLHDCFEIEHVTLQVVRTPFSRPCAAPDTGHADEPAARPTSRPSG